MRAESTMRSRIRSVTGRSLVVAGALALTACGNSTANADYIPTGTLVVVVRDQAGAAVSGADVQVLDRMSSFVWQRGTSGANGSVLWRDRARADAQTGETQTGLPGGDYRIAVTAPTGYVVASDQANPVVAHIADKQTTTITLKLAKNP